MSEIGKYETAEILRIARIFVPDAEYAPNESFYGDKRSIDFTDHCGCYSEWTQEPCYLAVFLKGSLEGDGHKQRMEVEGAIESWAHRNLTWSGCSCCGNSYLSVNVHLFGRSTKSQGGAK